MKQEKLVKIKQNTGRYNFADPNDETTNILISIPKYGFKHTFRYNPQEIRINAEELPWHEALDEITVTNPRTIKGRKKMGDIREIIMDEEKWGIIKEEWIKHRIEEIDERIKQLKKEKKELNKERGE